MFTMGTIIILLTSTTFQVALAMTSSPSLPAMTSPIESMTLVLDLSTTEVSDLTLQPVSPLPSLTSLVEMTSSLEPSNLEQPLDSTLQTIQISTATEPLSTKNLHMSSYYTDVNTSSELADVSFSTVDSAVTAEPTTLLFNLSTVTPTSVSDLMMSPSASMMSSITATTPSGPTTTQAPKPTTTPDPWAHLKCKRKLPPHAPDASFEVFVPGVLIYTCSPGFRQVSGSAFIRCGAAYGWVPGGLIVCEQVIIEKPPPPDPVPEWLVPMVTAAAVLLVVLVLSILLVVLCVKRAPFPKRVRPWQPWPPVEPAATKSGQGRRGWPWKRPWRTQRPTRPPPGHFGLDGVAWAVSDDNTIFPVKRIR